MRKYVLYVCLHVSWHECVCTYAFGRAYGGFRVCVRVIGPGREHRVHACTSTCV